jgi:hypothetical protein
MARTDRVRRAAVQVAGRMVGQVGEAEVVRTAEVGEEVTSINTIHHDSSIHTQGLEYSRPWFFSESQFYKTNDFGNKFRLAKLIRLRNFSIAEVFNHQERRQ